MHILQSIQWKRDYRPDNTEALYFTGTNYSLSSREIKLAKSGTLDFYSYCNIFNWKKWSAYTEMTDLKLMLNLKGHFLIEIYSDKKIVSQVEIYAQESWETEIHRDYKESLISIKITALEAGIFEGGCWYTSEIAQCRTNPVSIALVMCTFNRDEYLFRNLAVLSNHLPDNFDVFVVDNGNRIPNDKITEYGPRFHLFSNNNTGGSGGFTRGISEALQGEGKWSHVLLMDDDVTIEIEALWRTMSFLQILKKEFCRHFISGTMLRMDKPWSVHESTASWNGMRINSHKSGLDLREEANVALMEEEESAENGYAAWWYCVIPLQEDMLNDLPYPFFIYGDDMEYSLRRAEGIITLNGVCVWHEPFEMKYSAVMKSYFLSRNMLILNSLQSSRYNRFQLLGRLGLSFLVPLFVHDYPSVSLVLESAEDFIKGPEYNMHKSGEELLREKKAVIPLMQDVSTACTEGYQSIQLHHKKFKAPLYFFRKRIAAFDYAMESVDLRTRNLRTIALQTFKFLKIAVQIFFKYKELAKDYSSVKLDISFWSAVNKPLDPECSVNYQHLVD